MLRGISSRYTLFIASVLLAAMGLVLLLSGYLVFRGTSELSAELTDSFSTVQTASDIHALRANSAYLGNRLFDPLYNLDVSALNEEIAQIDAWLSPESVLILDADGRVVTDGTISNPDHDRQIEIPADLSRDMARIEEIADGQIVSFAIGYGSEIAGYARIRFSNERNRQLLGALHAKVEHSWKDFEGRFLSIALISIVLTAVASLLIGSRLSRTVSRPLRDMSHAVEQYAAGNLTHKLPEGSADELGRLADSLNRMATDLDKASFLLMRAQEMAALGSWEWEREQDRLQLSHGVYRIFGIAPASFSATIDHFVAFFPEEDRSRLADILRGAFETSVSIKLSCDCADGETRILLLRGESNRDAEGRVIGTVGTVQDITEQQRAKDQLMLLANYDSLTGLPNRNLFYDRLRQAISKAKRDQRQVALFFLDLDRFKAINDALGHDVGDDLLSRVAKRLKEVVRECDTLARIGGDEFTLIVENLIDDYPLPAIAQKMIDVLTPPFALAERQLYISVSVGIAIYPGDAESLDTLIKHADTAMYAAKEQGKGTFRFFTLELQQIARDRLAIEGALREAIDQLEFELHYQPQVRADDGRLVAIEALLRWRHGGRLESPAAFIGVLEETGLITRLTAWVLRTAAQALQQLQQQSGSDLRVCVNLSARQFQQPNLLDLIDETLAECALQSAHLEIEITESTLLDDERCQDNATQLAARGIRLALDDFGTGYSSLTYLKRFDVDVLKIDRSFVRDMIEDQGDAQIVSTVLALAAGLGIESVAEGVEVNEQKDRLRGLGCDLIQGYLICPPVGIQDLLVWTRQQQ